MIRVILKLYCLFINFWKHFNKLFKLFIKVVGTGANLEVLGVLLDWTQHRLCNIKIICNIFFIRYFGWPALLMKTNWTFGTQNLIMVTAEVSSWIGTGVIFTIKSISLQPYISCAILNLNYRSVICLEL